MPFCSLFCVGCLRCCWRWTLRRPCSSPKSGITIRTGTTNGEVNDPTGVWLQRSVPVILITFHSHGTYSADVQGESAFLPGNESPGFQLTSPTHALWKKTGPKTLVATSFAMQYNDDGSFYGLLKVRVTGVLSASGDQMDLTVSGGVFVLNGNLIPNPPFPGSTGHFERLRLEFP